MQWFIPEENTSPKCQTPPKVSICPLSDNNKLLSDQDRGEDYQQTDQLSWDIFKQFKVFGFATSCCISWPGGCLRQQVTDVEVLTWQGYKWTAIVLQNFRKIHWRNLTVVKWRFKSRSTGLVDVPAASMPTTHSLKAWNICGSVIKLYIFWVAFKCDQSTAHMLNNHDVQSASW